MATNSNRTAAVTFLVAWLLAGCANTGPACNQTPPLALTTYFDDFGIPLVLAGVNQTAATMIFDTGAELSILTPEIASQASLSVHPSTNDILLIGATGSVSPKETTVNNFILGNAEGRNVKFLVADMAARGATGSMGDIDGDLATNVISNYNVDLDFPSGQVTLYQQDRCSAGKPPWPAPYTAIPIKTTYYGKVYVPVAIDGKLVYALLDTGTSVSLISYAQLTASGIASDLSDPVRRILVHGIGGHSNSAELYKLKRLTIGAETIQAPIFAVFGKPKNAQEAAIFQLFSAMHPPPTFGSFEPPPFQVVDTVVLGEDYIRRHRLFISYSTDKLYVQP